MLLHVLPHEIQINILVPTVLYYMVSEAGFEPTPTMIHNYLIGIKFGHECFLVQILIGTHFRAVSR